MGHAHHFLSRLDRLTRPHVELALALYRDDERLRYVLEHASLPEGAERVAVSLDDPREGPFVLVTRNGKFVTCLARGMQASNLPIVTRAELDAITAKHGVFREREAARARLTGPDGEAGFLLGRILDAGPFLAREELQALAALHPLIGDAYFDMGVEWSDTSLVLRNKLKNAVKKRGTRLWPLQLEQLEMYYKTFFAAGHLAVLSAVDGGEMLLRRAEGDESVLVAVADSLSTIVLGGGILTRTVRSAWALAQLGRAWLPLAKRQLAEATRCIDVMRAALALLAIGARHDDLRDEVLRAFNPVPKLATAEAQEWATWVCGGGANILRDLDGILAGHLRDGARVALAFSDLFPKSSPYHYTRAEDVPDDIAYSSPFQLPVEYTRDHKTMGNAIGMIACSARADAEQLYMPRRYVEFLEEKWEPEHSLALMGGWLEQQRNPAPRPTGPTRNGPCPCGSGKKYKRCCAEAGAP